MPGQKLSREEIALSILNGIISTLVGPESSKGAIYHLADDTYGSGVRREVCLLAFQMADHFIRERDRKE